MHAHFYCRQQCAVYARPPHCAGCCDGGKTSSSRPFSTSGVPRPVRATFGRFSAYIARFKALTGCSNAATRTRTGREWLEIADECGYAGTALRAAHQRESCEPASPNMSPRIVEIINLSTTMRIGRVRRDHRNSASTVNTRMFYARKQLAELPRAPASRPSRLRSGTVTRGQR